MSLRRKLIFKDLLILLSLIGVVGACLGGLFGQRAHVQASLDEYSAIRFVESANAHLVSVNTQLDDKQPDFSKMASELRAAQKDLRWYKAMLTQYKTVLPVEVSTGQQDQAKLTTQGALDGIAALIAMVDSAQSSTDRTDAQHAAASISILATKTDETLVQLSELLRVCNVFLNQTQMTSDHDLHWATVIVASIAGATAIIAALASFWQYRRIMVPLKALRRWCGSVATGDFSQAYVPSGDSEFVELGNDVNKMAAELGAFYRQLEEMVRMKSRELVRSERLASVGYLAAGVAHEINNPLNIMSGYAELSTKRLGKSTNTWVVSEVLEALAIIRDEAFRCKEITGKLLSLAKGGSDGREVISIAGVINDMATMVYGLKQFAGRHLRVEIAGDDPLYAQANITEMKQVMLNLIVNALEAVPAGSGQIVITAAHQGKWIEVVVSDNGRGMSQQTLEQIFEPFYTDKRGTAAPGTGLGLSITHAIITNHGGEIRAESDGPGRGSRIIVRLPTENLSPETPPVASEAQTAPLQEAAS